MKTGCRKPSAESGRVRNLKSNKIEITTGHCLLILQVCLKLGGI